MFKAEIPASKIKSSFTPAKFLCQEKAVADCMLSVRIGCNDTVYPMNIIQDVAVSGLQCGTFALIDLVMKHDSPFDLLYLSEN